MDTESAYHSITICNCLGIVCDCYDPDCVGTTLAMALDIAVACDPTFKDRYLAIYGVAYEGPLCNALPRKSFAPTTTAKTVNR